MDLFNQTDLEFMKLALEQAKIAAAEDEVPVGALVVFENEIIGSGYDCKMKQADPTAHAEIIAIRQAAEKMGDWRLENCTLYVTLEPCPMCAGAIVMSRIKRLVYGADNRKFGACETVTNLIEPHPNKWNHQVEIEKGILADECAKVLTDYFSSKRQKKN